MPTLSRLNVTPVKSLRLRHPERAELTERGVAGNRQFYLIRPDGKLFTGGDAGHLQQVTCAWDAATETLALTFPDSGDVTGSAADLGEAVETDFYGRTVRGHVVSGPFGEALSAHAGTPLRLVRCDAPGDAYDVEPVTLVSLASVGALAAGARGSADLDARRFRMNLELEGCAAYEEDSWVGANVRVGDAIVQVGEQVPRCAVTTLDPLTGRKDFPTLTEIARQRGRIAGRNGLPFGMYARVIRPGSVAVGDPVERIG